MRYTTIVVLEEFRYTDIYADFEATIIKKLSEEKKTELHTNNYVLLSYDPEPYMIFTEQHPLFNILVMRDCTHELFTSVNHSINNIRSYNANMRKLIKELYLKAKKI